jgi:hypothetical protein
MWLVWGKREMHTGFWLVNLKEKDHLEELDIVCNLSMLVAVIIVSVEQDQIQTLLKQDKKADILKGVN